MVDRPILFSDPMVQALVAGRKTKTRRIVHPSPGLQSGWLDDAGIRAAPTAEIAWSKDRLGVQLAHPQGGPLTWVKRPYGIAINGRGSWDLNPWVWVLTFEVER